MSTLSNTRWELMEDLISYAAVVATVGNLNG